MNYMGKKTNKRQMAIITLSDHNKEIIKNIKEEKKQMEDEYEEKKKGNKFRLWIAGKM